MNQRLTACPISLLNTHKHTHTHSLFIFLYTHIPSLPLSLLLRVSLYTLSSSYTHIPSLSLSLHLSMNSLIVASKNRLALTCLLSSVRAGLKYPHFYFSTKCCCRTLQIPFPIVFLDLLFLFCLFFVLESFLEKRLHRSLISRFNWGFSTKVMYKV